MPLPAQGRCTSGRMIPEYHWTFLKAAKSGSCPRALKAIAQEIRIQQESKTVTIEVEHINKAYNGKPVLTDFSLDISSDTSYLVMGPSGAGKTTLLRIILGLEQPDEGRIRLLGDYKYSRVNAGVVFQEDRLCESFSAVENVAMVSRKLSERVAREELVKLLPPDELDKPVRELSGGMRRRVCIVRACSIPSDVIIMDEPFTGLDPDNRQKCIDYIRQMQGSTPLVLTGHSAEGLSFCKIVQIL